MFVNDEAALAISARLAIGKRFIGSILVLPPDGPAPRGDRPDALAIDLRPLSQTDVANERHIVANIIGRLRQDEPSTPALLALIRPFKDADALSANLAAIVAAKLDGIILPEATSGADVQKLDVMLSVEEAMAGLDVGKIPIIALGGDNAAGLLAAASFAAKSTRLKGFGWSPFALAETIGTLPANPQGEQFTGTLGIARGLTRLGAAAAGIAAVDWLDPQLQGDAAARTCEAALRDGFGAIITTRPEHVAAINRAFAALGAEAAG
ncbi:MAG: hypothetical protein ACYC10_00550 [Allorhizobium sp.]